MTIDSQFRRIQGPDSRVPEVKPQTVVKAKNKRVNETLTGKPQGSAAQPARASKTSQVNNSSANDFQSNQQRNVELRGTTLFLMPMGSDSPVPPGDLKAATGGNAFEIWLAADYDLDFDWSEFDAMSGSRRGNLRVDRLCFMTVIIHHNGFDINLPAGILWHDGEAPDLTPSDNESIHVLNFMARRRILVDGSDTLMFGGVWALNAAEAV